jgi:predicted nucleotidyltransferase
MPEFSKIAELLSTRINGLQSIYVYGSFATGHANENSDLDIAILADTRLDLDLRLELAVKLSGMIGRDIDLIDLRRVPTVMQMQVVQHGLRIYSPDLATCDAFEDFVFSSYARLNEERRDILNDVISRGNIYG